MCAAEAASTQNLWKIGRSTGAWLNVSKIGMMEEGKNCTLARFMISADNVHCSSAPCARRTRTFCAVLDETKFGLCGAHKCAYMKLKLICQQCNYGEACVCM